ncbi:MAG TPA: iron-containing alcohol dehydrogenase [Chloroflexota bacterium]|nr:iron-containing alcohol dehydrogenase [Chloroflexota bacterium]
MAQTNVKDIRFGRGIVDGVARDIGRFAVSTMEIPWGLVKDRLGAAPAHVIMVRDMERAYVEQMERETPEVDAVVTVGGGQAMDMGKYIADKRKLHLINIPTIVSTNAYVTSTAGLREPDGSVRYVGKISPDLVIVDFDLIRTAPPGLNRAGAGDILSCHTGSFDWELARREGHDDWTWSEGAIPRVRALVERLSREAAEIRDVTDAGIRAIVECYLEINDICMPLGHYRAEEGSEHFFAYNVEAITRVQYVHGHLVGLGIRLLSRLQGNRPEWIEDVMRRIGLSNEPRDVNLTRPQVEQALRTLREYAVHHNYWYSVINSKPITEEVIATLTRDMAFAEGDHHDTAE